MKCRYCGKEFKPAHGSTRYCTVECRDKHSGRVTYNRGTTAVCANCGGLFIKQYGSEKYCCVECREEATAAKQNEWNKEHRHRQRKAKACEYCGREFIPNGGGQKYCTDQCKQKAKHNGMDDDEWLEYLKERRAENLKKANAARPPATPKPKKEPYIGTCVVCGAGFETMNPVQKTCSKDCGRRLRNSRKQKRIPKENIIDNIKVKYRRQNITIKPKDIKKIY